MKKVFVAVVGAWLLAGCGAAPVEETESKASSSEAMTASPENAASNSCQGTPNRTHMTGEPYCVTCCRQFTVTSKAMCMGANECE